MKKLIISFFTLLMFTINVFAADTNGIGGFYCYMIFTYLPNYASIINYGMQSDWLDGFTFPLQWNRIETSPGVYDWSTIDPWLQQAMQYNKKLIMSVESGYYAPTWLTNSTYKVPFLQFNYYRGNICSVVNQPVYWNNNYQERYLIFITAIANHLKSLKNPNNANKTAYDNLKGFKIGGVNITTDEIRIVTQTGNTSDPCNLTDGNAAWQQAGYTPTKSINALMTFADMTRNTFPDKIMIVDTIHKAAFPNINDQGQIISPPPSSAPDPMTQLYINQFILKYGNQVMIKWDALNNVIGYLPKEVIKAGQEGARVGWQMNGFMGAGINGGSGCIYPGFVIQACKTMQDFKTIVDNGIKTGGQVIEIAPANTNDNYADIFRSYNLRFVH